MCRICEEPCDGERPWVLNLLGEAAHVGCLEATGEWDESPRADNEKEETV